MPVTVNVTPPNKAVDFTSLFAKYTLKTVLTEDNQIDWAGK